jgi:glutamate-1-semialdehyde 2,1-aminomutase
LAANSQAVQRIRAGLVLTLLGDPGGFTYKRSRRGDSLIDRAVEHVLRHSRSPHAVIDFSPFGYDERQYGSPGFNLPVGCLMRTPHGEFPEYHTSADNLDLVRPEALAESLELCWSIVEALEHNRSYVNRQPWGEPQLGRRGLYKALGGTTDQSQTQKALLWTLNLSDGKHDLLAMAQRAGLPIESFHRAAELLGDHGLLDVAEPAAEAHPRTSADWQQLAHRLIPGGCHTYAKGDDQYPLCAPAVIERGRGSHVWDVEGRDYIEYGAGLRSVTLGHAFGRVVDAVTRQLALGANFNRPSTIEIETAQELLDALPEMEMVKFAKNASDCTTAAVKLARACTGRDLVALCGDQPFFSCDDWFIGTTAMDAGIPQAIRDLSLTFRFNDLASLEDVLMRHAGRVACVVLEPATVVEPGAGYLAAVRDLCQRHGALLVFDETITGFRWHLGGAQAYYGVTPDLAVFGKALGNGFAVSALVGKRQFMERGGLEHPHERVFLLSTTHGAETHALAAAREVIRTYRDEPVIATLWRQGERLRGGVEAAVRRHGLAEYVQVIGPACNLVYAARDERGERSQAFRALLLQELLRRGILAPSLVVGYSHSNDDIDRTSAAFDEALEVYSAALREGVEKYLVGRPVKPVFRRFN